MTDVVKVIFMVIFTVECFSAIIAKGLWQHDEAYLKVNLRVLKACKKANIIFCFVNNLFIN